MKTTSMTIFFLCCGPQEAEVFMGKKEDIHTQIRVRLSRLKKGNCLFYGKNISEPLTNALPTS